MTQQAGTTDELAAVVLADEGDDTGVAWHVRLRPWLVALVFLVLAECSARVVFDRTLVWRTERFDNFPGPAALDNTIRGMKRDRAIKILILGDSTIPGSVLLAKDETMPRKLEAALSHRVPDVPVHVWDLGLSGSRSTDQLCMLLQALDGSPDIVVVEEDQFICGMDIRPLPLFNPWLARNLPTIPDSVAPFVKARPWKEEFEDSVTNFFEKHVRLVGMRQAVNAMAFGVQTRNAPFESPNPTVMLAHSVGKRYVGYKPRAWNAGGDGRPEPMAVYDAPVLPDNMSGRFYRQIASTLATRRIPAIAYLTPQNPAIVAYSTSPERERESRRALLGFMAGPGIELRDLTDLVPSNEFIDMTHLVASGNERLAEALASAIEPMVRRAIANNKAHVQ